MEGYICNQYITGFKKKCESENDIYYVSYHVIANYNDKDQNHLILIKYYFYLIVVNNYVHKLDVHKEKAIGYSRFPTCAKYY
jgi:hypothetical protein